MSIGQRVKRIRVSRKMSQETLARLVGIKQPTLSDLENTPTATTSKIAQIAKALGVDAYWLETGKGDMHAGYQKGDSKLYRLDDEEMWLMNTFRESSGFERDAILAAAKAAEAKALAGRSRLVVNDKG